MSVQEVAGGTPVSSRVTASVLDLPQRYLPDRAPPGAVRYRLRITGQMSFTIIAQPDGCLIGPARDDAATRRGGPSGIGDAHAELVVDAESWLALAAGEVSGPELFLAGRLQVHGDLNEALRLETLFAPPDGSWASNGHARIGRYEVAGSVVETFEAGDPGAPAALLLHGLGASKVSLLPVIAGLSATHRVIAMDFPGFGKSGVPLLAPYTPGWLARVAEAVLDEAGVDRADVVGNSLGGRVAVELALRAPGRVSALALLCPAVAFDEYRLMRPLLRLSRMDIVCGVPRWLLPRRVVDLGLGMLFADATRVPRQNLDAARDEFLRSVRPVANRLAIAAVTRRLALEDPNRFWRRLDRLGAPSLWVFGTRDRLVRQAYAAQVRRHAPAATVEVWRSCGHVPQFEYPHRTVGRLHAFFVESGQAGG